MNTIDIANRLVELCRLGKNEESLTTLFADDAVSVEAVAPPGTSAESKGLAALKGKGEWWRANHQIHSAVLTGPWPHGDRFVVGFEYDITFKPTGARHTMSEVGLFTVANGKIIREEFFYNS